jgi:hypothetical protein
MAAMNELSPTRRNKEQNGIGNVVVVNYRLDRTKAMDDLKDGDSKGCKNRFQAAHSRLAASFCEYLQTFRGWKMDQMPQGRGYNGGDGTLLCL